MLVKNPGGSDGKKSACNVGDLGCEDPLGREGLPTLVFWPGEFRGCVVHGVAELDTAKRLLLFTNYLCTHVFIKHTLCYLCIFKIMSVIH